MTVCGKSEMEENSLKKASVHVARKMCVMSSIPVEAADGDSISKHKLRGMFAFTTTETLTSTVSVDALL